MRFASALFLLVLPATLIAQGAEPKRPQLLAGADTNDAQSYHDYGLGLMQKRPADAADAFYWASRLDPNNGNHFYARRVALLLTDRRRLERYWSGNTSTLRSKDIKRIDSLYLHALTLNPFLYESLDRILFRAVVDEYAQQVQAAGGSAGEYEAAVDRMLARSSPSTKAWQAYTEGRFDESLELYAKAIKAVPPKYRYSPRSMRGRLFYQLNQVDSALAHLTVAVEEMRARDAKDFVYVYESKALYEQAVGMAHERLGDTASARKAYARALQEDLAYSPAHLRLAFMAIDAKDTTNAIGEFDLAAQLRPEDSALRYQYGFVLAMTGKHAEALEQLDKSIALNPWYAAPHQARGFVLEAQGKKGDALAAYKSFLARASKQDPRRSDVAKRVESLATGAN